MKNSRRFFILFAITAFQQFNLSRAGVCYSACFNVCTGLELNYVFRFAPPSVWIGYAACAIGCQLGCKGAGKVGLPTLGCFARDTVIRVLEDGAMREKPINLVKENDEVLTLKNNQQSWTRVVRNVKSKGPFRFVQVTTQNLQDGTKKQVTVTPEHGVVLLSKNGKMIISAENITLGSKLISNTGDPVLVIDITNLMLDEKYTLETADGTVIASGVFVTTICADEIAGKTLAFDPAMKDWRSRHPYVKVRLARDKTNRNGTWDNGVTIPLGAMSQNYFGGPVSPFSRNLTYSAQCIPAYEDFNKRIFTS